MRKIRLASTISQFGQGPEPRRHGFERLGCRRTSRRPITYARLRRDPRGRDGSL